MEKYIGQVTGRYDVANFFLTESTCVAGAVPVKIGHHRGLASQFRIPEALQEVPVNEPLDVNLATLDS